MTAPASDVEKVVLLVERLRVYREVERPAIRQGDCEWSIWCDAERAADTIEALSALGDRGWDAAIEAAAKANCLDCATDIPFTGDGRYHLAAGVEGDAASVVRWCHAKHILALRRPATGEG